MHKITEHILEICSKSALLKAGTTKVERDWQGSPFQDT